MSRELPVTAPAVNSSENPCLPVSNNAEPNGETSVANESEERLTLNQWLLLTAFFLCNFFLGTDYALLAPFFPKEAEKKGASPTVYGLIIGLYQLVVFFMSPVCGKLAPILTPNLLAYGGIFIAGVSAILFGILEWCPPGKPFIVLAFLIRSFDAVGWACYFTGSYTIVATTFKKRRATILANLETLFGFGMITGPTLGGALYQAGGYYLPFIVMGSVLLAGSVISFFVVPTIHDMPTESPGTMRKLMKNPIYLIDLFICVSSMMAVGFNDATLEPHLRQFNLQPIVLGTIFIVLGGIYALGSPVWGYLCDKMSNVLLLCAIGVTCSIVGFLFIGPVPFIPLPTTLWLVCVAQLFLGLGMGGKLICAFIHAMKEALVCGLPNDVTTYGAVFGTVVSACSLGAFIGPSLGGFLLDHVGYKNATIYMVGIEVVTAIIVWVYAIREMKRNRRASQHTDEERPLLNGQ